MSKGKSGRRLRRPDAMKDPDTGLSKRERELVDVLASCHKEFGLTATMTHEALRHLTHESWPGSLAALVMKGYAAQQKAADDTSIGYRLTERGWALYAGVDERLAEPEEPVL